MNTFSQEILNRLRNLEHHLASQIKGQDHIIPRMGGSIGRSDNHVVKRR